MEIVPIKRGGLDAALKDKYGLERIAPEFMPKWMQDAIYHTATTHTAVMFGNALEGYTLKIICDSTMGIVQLPCNDRATPTDAYPRCRFCGHIFNNKGVIEAEAEIVFDTDQMDAWPALPRMVDEFGSAG